MPDLCPHRASHVLLLQGAKQGPEVVGAPAPQDQCKASAVPCPYGWKSHPGNAGCGQSWGVGGPRTPTHLQHSLALVLAGTAEGKEGAAGQLWGGGLPAEHLAGHSPMQRCSPPARHAHTELVTAGSHGPARRQPSIASQPRRCRLSTWLSEPAGSCAAPDMAPTSTSSCWARLRQLQVEQ